MAQSVKHLTLDFRSGHDLTVCEIEPLIGLCTDNKKPAWDFLSLTLPLPGSHALFHPISPLFVLYSSMSFAKCIMPYIHHYTNSTTQHSHQNDVCLFIHSFIYLLIYLLEREHERGRGAEGERENIKQTPCSPWSSMLHPTTLGS